jgi:phage gpG-like protein
MIFKGSIEGVDRVMLRLNSLPDILRTRLERVIRRLGIDLQAHVKDDKLSGQVLHVRSGTLRRSINLKMKNSLTAIQATVGTNVKYAHAHEYGLDQTVDVRGYMRLVKGSTTPLTAWKRSVNRSTRAGLRGVTETFVRPHSMHMRLPERSFLRSALHDMTAQIQITIWQEGLDALRKENK